MQTSLKTLWQKIRIFIGKLGETLRLAPAEIFTTVYAFITFTLAYEKVSPIQEEYIALAPLVFGLSFILNRLCHGKWRLIYYLSPLVYVLFIKTDLKDWITSTEYIIALLICPLAVILSDWIKENKRFAERIIRYLVDWVAAGLLALVAYLLVNAIVYSFGYIFDLHIPSKFSFYAFLSASILLTPLCFLTFNRQSEQTPDRPIPGNSFLDILARYVLTPAAWIYTIILYLYFVCIAITWFLPRGGIAYLVFGFILFATILKALQPLLQRQPCKWFYERFSLISLPAPIMFWIGVWYRIEQYGFTQARTYLVICGIIMTATVLIFFSPKTGKYLYANLFAIALLGIFTYIPGITAKDIGLKSQMQRIENISRRLHLLDDTGKFIAEKRPASDSIYQKEYGELYESLEYLYLEEDTDLSEKYGIESPSDLYSLIAPDAATPEYLSDTAVSGTLYSDDTVIDIAGYSSLHKIQYYKQEGCYYCTETDSSFILISPLEDTLINETLDTILKSQLKKAGLSENSPADSLKKHKQELLTYDTDAGRIVFGYLDIKQDSVLVLNYLSAELFLQK